jgi:hypothetical protein
MTCQSYLREGRPDRGPEAPCPYRARYMVFRGTFVGLRVCGYHRRAFVPDAVGPLLEKP